jgi:antitoxin HigA-1
MEMFNPPHPGLILKDTVLREDGGISVKEFAEKLGMTRTAISRVVNLWQIRKKRRPKIQRMAA